MSDITNRLHDLLDKAPKATRSRLAKELDIAPQAISQWTQAHKEPTVPDVDRLVQVAAFFKVRKEWLVFGDLPKFVNESAMSAAALLQPSGGNSAHGGDDSKVNKLEFLRVASKVPDKHLLLACDLLKPLIEEDTAVPTERPPQAG